MSDNITTLEPPKKTRKRKKPVTILVYLDEGNPVTHQVADDETGWGVMYDNCVLSITDVDEVRYYYPLGNLTKWSVKDLDD